MQNIQIDTALYNQLVEAGINIQDELQKLVDSSVSDVKASYKKSLYSLKKK